MFYSGRLRWAGHVLGMGEKRSTYKVSVRKYEGKKQIIRKT
jgi:hypothetical protein